MSSDLSPELDRFIDDVVATGAFPSRSDALNEAVRMLQRRQELLAHIQEGARQLRSGEYTDYTPGELRDLFDDIQAEGRARFEASRERP